MNTNLSSSASSQLETECLVVGTLDHSEKDHGEKDKPVVAGEGADAAVRAAAKDVIASGEVTAKAFETTLLHRPAGLKAKRLLLVGGGKAKTLSAAELRKLAGAAVRTIVEGAFVGNFDPGYYKSDRKDKDNDKKIDSVTILVRSDTKPLESALQAGRIVGESQNFTRDLVNEPSNRMTPTILAERARKMAADVGLKCEVYGPDKIKELKMGAFWGV